MRRQQREYMQADQSTIHCGRLLLRSWHRGTHENDLILSSFGGSTKPTVVQPRSAPKRMVFPLHVPQRRLARPPAPERGRGDLAQGKVAALKGAKSCASRTALLLLQVRQATSERDEYRPRLRARGRRGGHCRPSSTAPTARWRRFGGPEQRAIGIAYGPDLRMQVRAALTKARLDVLVATPAPSRGPAGRVRHRQVAVGWCRGGDRRGAPLVAAAQRASTQ